MNAYCIHKKHNAENARLKDRPMGALPKNQTLRYCILPCQLLFRSRHAFTSMDGEYADFAGVKICQSNALILAFGQRQNL